MSCSLLTEILITDAKNGPCDLQRPRCNLEKPSLTQPTTFTWRFLRRRTSPESVYHFISCGLSPLRKLNEEAR